MCRGCIALLIVVSSAVSASAQGAFVTVSAVRQQAGASVDDVVARMMQFDRNSDFKLAIDELPERMKVLVVRGDRSEDLMLDIGEIRRLTGLRPQVFFPSDTQRVAIYGFGDVFGTLSSRTHIENSIDDLRLAPQTADEAKRIAFAQVEEFERSAGSDGGRLTDERRARLIARLGDVLTEEERDDLNAALARRPLVKRPAGINVLELLAEKQSSAESAGGGTAAAIVR
jgi:hypothetical protein